MPTQDVHQPVRDPFWLFAGPFCLFIGLQSLPGVLRAGQPGAPFWRAVPEFWIYPLQTILCAAVLIRFARVYPRWIDLRGALIGLSVGVVVLGIWISPQSLFHAPARVNGGFDPHRLPAAAAGSQLAYAANVALRFTRLVLVVPVLEEVFWRGFLLRYLVRPEFTSVPMGTFTPVSFGVVALGFMVEHNPPDWPAALITGALYNLVAIRTKSLPACVLAHAVTNLLLGVYIMQTRQWGFW